MNIKKVGVVGCGVMGSGIVTVCALKEYDVTFVEINDSLVNKGLNNIKSFLHKGVEKGKFTSEQVEKTLTRICGTTDIGKLATSDIVIEAVIENLEEKLKIFAVLDKICKESAILASNTSSISITKLASVTKRPEKVIGIHFFNPVPIMKLIEIVRGLQTSEETYNLAKGFCESLGKVVVSAKDNPGFIVNYLLIPYLLESVRALENGIASKEDIDTAMKLGCGLPMGPIELIDFIGVDTTLYIADAMYAEYKDPKLAAPPLLRKMVAAGFLGKKAGKGFYDYTQNK